MDGACNEKYDKAYVTHKTLNVTNYFAIFTARATKSYFMKFRMHLTRSFWFSPAMDWDAILQIKEWKVALSMYWNNVLKMSERDYTNKLERGSYKVIWRLLQKR